MLAIIVPLMLMAVAPSDTDRGAIEERFVEIYRPYMAGSGGAPAQSMAIYSAELTALIAQWQSAAPQDEPDALSDGDWLCQCQEWDGLGFQATIVSIGMASENVAEVDVSVDLGVGGGPEAARAVRLITTREEGAWKVDDMVADSFPTGLKQVMRETIAATGPPPGERG